MAQSERFIDTIAITPTMARKAEIPKIFFMERNYNWPLTCPMIKSYRTVTI